MPSPSRRSPPLAGCWLAFLCAAVAIVACALFLPHQSLWIDESTQLTGDAMGPAQVVRWLTGHGRLVGVAPDRSPPVSYWLGQMWGHAFGHGMHAMRWLGVACVGLAAAIVCATGRRAFGRVGGLLAGLLFALSPNVVTYAVEIRAYPIFLLVATAAVGAFVRQLLADDDRSRNRHLAVMTGLCVVATYVHFFGLVLAGALLSATLLTRLVNRRPVAPVLVAIGAIGIAAVGLYPFVTASVNVSQLNSPEATNTGGVRAAAADVAHLLYRLVGHPAIGVSRIVIAAALFGALGLTVSSLCVAFRRRTPDVTAAKQRDALIGLAATLALGLLAVAAASLVVKSFHTAAPHYNCWMLPCVCLLLAGAVSSTCGKARMFALLATAALLASQAYGTAQLAVRGDAFAHGPYSRLARVVDRLGPRHVTVLLDGPDTSIAGGVYFPFRYLFGPGLRQYVLTSSESSHPQVRVFDPPDSPTMALSDVSVMPGDYVMVIASRNVTGRELADDLHRPEPEGQPLLEEGPASRFLAADAAHWERVETRSYLSLVAARLDVYRRRE